MPKINKNYTGPKVGGNCKMNHQGAPKEKKEKKKQAAIQRPEDCQNVSQTRHQGCQSEE